MEEAEFAACWQKCSRITNGLLGIKLFKRELSVCGMKFSLKVLPENILSGYYRHRMKTVDMVVINVVQRYPSI